MPDFRVADTAPEHRKLRRAGLLGFGLWAAAGAWAMKELTDGWVPEYWVLSWPNGARAAQILIDVRLWVVEARDGIPGYVFHDWEDIQRSAAQIIAERERAKERAAKSRARAAARNGERQPARSGAAPPQRARDSHDSLSLPLSPTGRFGEEPSGSRRADAENGHPPKCPNHPELPIDHDQPPACGLARNARLGAYQYAADQAERDAEVRARRRALIDACPDCSDTGMRDMGDLGQTRCTHPDLDADTA